MIDLPGFTLKECLHQGSLHVVYRGIRLKDYRSVILKTTVAERPEIQQIARLRREYEILQHLAGEAVVRALELKTHHRSVVLVLEDLGGQDLRQALNLGGLGIGDFLELALRIAPLIEKIHRHFIVHKDLNPTNIVINRDSGEIKIIDFGIASQLSREDHRGVETPAILEGTLAYIAPEQTGRMNRSMDYRADYYALGMTFYEMLAGRPPFRGGDPMELVHAHLARKPPALRSFNPQVPEPLCGIIDKLIAKAPENRYQTIQGLMADLGFCLKHWRQQDRIPAFTPGERDCSDRFQVPEKLYGREAEREHLLNAFQRATQGTRGLVLITGYTGMGKSSLVREVQKPMAATRGYLASGKFDALQGETPYAPLIQAFRGLLRQILTENEERLAYWQEKLRSNLGGNGRILTEVMSELSLVIGPQPSLPEVPASEARHRFQLVFLNFAKTFAAKAHPLVLFLDDLHWADKASLNLIKILLTHPDPRYLLTIGNYRQDACPQGHPIYKFLADIHQQEVRCESIGLQALDLTCIHQMLMDTFKRGAEATLPLAKLCLEKTNGNPLFLNQFLEELYRGGQVQFDSSQSHWHWDLEKIKAVGITENLAAFMTARLARIQPHTRKVLTLAACIGHQFDLSTLALIHGRPPRETSADLWEALKEGLVIPRDDRYKFPEIQDGMEIFYHFLHDRVHQAAYALLEDEEKARVHLEIGRLLYGNTPEERLQEKIFDIVHHLNHGMSLIDQQAERTNLARLNLAAGHKAKSASAYEAALEYHAKGIRLLRPDSWRDQHALSFALFLEHAECLHLCGKPAEAERSFGEIFKHVQSRLEKAKVFAIQILVETHLNRPLPAIEAAIEGLAQFGIRFPVEEEAQAAALDAAMAEIDQLIGARPIDDLLHLPPMEDVNHLAVMMLLMNMTPPTYHVRRHLFHLVIAEMMKTTLRHGNAISSAFAFVNYGTLLITRFQQIHKGYTFGNLALVLMERFPVAGITFKVTYIFATFINHWQNHVRTSLPLFQKAQFYAFESGDVLFASYVGHHYLDTCFYRGESLEDIKILARKYLEFANTEDPLDATRVIQIHHQAALCLSGETLGSSSLTDTGFDEKEFREQLAGLKVLYPRITYLILKTYLLLCDDRPVEAMAKAREAHPHIESLAGMLLYVEHHFLYALAISRCQALQPQALEQGQLDLFQQLRQRLEQWSGHCETNFRHKAALLEAEDARMSGRMWEAVDHYERAIQCARGQSFFHFEGMCHELAGLFWANSAKTDFAQLHLERAVQDYRLWGATRLAERLESQHGVARLSPKLATRAVDTATATSSLTESTYEILDLNTVIRASQAISKSLVLEELLDTLLSILLEHAGAERGCLILHHLETGDFRIEVEGDVDSGRSRILHGLPLERYPRLALSVLHYTLRTREVVVLNDAMGEGLFTTDPYVVDQQPKSVLCVPVFHRGKLNGALYLENNHAAGAFTADRVEVLRMLAAQAAISLEKARLYTRLEEYSKDLEGKVTERTEELKRKNRELAAKNDVLVRTQKQLVLQEKMASMGLITAGVAHEIRNPLNFINNFSVVAKEMALELRELLKDRFPDAMEQEEICTILKDLEENALLIDRHGKRAEGIVQKMQELTRGPAVIRKSTSVNPLVGDYVKLAYNGMYTRGGVVDVQFENVYDPLVGHLEIAAQDLGRVIFNLIDNACYAVTEKSKEGDQHYIPRITVGTKDRDGQVEIFIRDNGTGMPQAIVDKIFTPFFTTKSASKQHIGLGLSIAFDIVQGHQGTIKVSSVLGSYTEMSIVLPKG